MYKTSYVLITPAYNEEAYIEKTIQSIISQSILPKKWIIASDSSTDRTDEIVSQYTKNHSFIQLVRVPQHSKRDVGLKVNAFNVGFAQLNGIEYDFLGNLDADVSFGSNYFEYILEKFQQNPKLGMAGGVVFELFNGNWVQLITRLNASVGGQTQFFRREVFEEIGGYTLISGGGEDVVADNMTRRLGWEVRSFPEVKVFHHRQMGTEGRNVWRARFMQGVRDYLVGYHPLYEIAKCIRRIAERPYALGSLLWLSGYFWANLLRYKSPVRSDIVKYIRKEQIKLLLKPFIIFLK